MRIEVAVAAVTGGGGGGGGGGYRGGGGGGGYRGGGGPVIKGEVEAIKGVGIDTKQTQSRSRK